MLARTKMESALGTGVDVCAMAPRSLGPDARQNNKSIKVRARALKPTNWTSFCGPKKGSDIIFEPRNRSFPPMREQSAKAAVVQARARWDQTIPEECGRRRPVLQRRAQWLRGPWIWGY